MKQPQVISRAAQWDTLARRLRREPELAVDTEANSGYAYRGRICLVQIAAAGSAYLVDPLAIDDLAALGLLLADAAIVKVMHGSDYDLRCLSREYGFRVSGLFDTETGARFLGMQNPNLAAVVRHFLQVDIPKSRRLQRSNWALRPLSAAALQYAAADVEHLSPLAGQLRRALRQAGRLEWAQEEFLRLEEAGVARHEPPGPAFLRVKGSDRLTPRELAVLQEVFAFREAEAEQLDRPPHWIMDNATLLQLARQPTRPLADLPNLSSHFVRRSGNQLRAAVQKGMNGPEYQRPDQPRRNPPTREMQVRLQKLKQWRSDRGAELGIDPSLLWPALSLERLAQDPTQWEREIMPGGAKEVRAWQVKEFSRELAATLKAAA